MPHPFENDKNILSKLTNTLIKYCFGSLSKERKITPGVRVEVIRLCQEAIHANTKEESFFTILVDEIKKNKLIKHSLQSALSRIEELPGVHENFSILAEKVLEALTQNTSSAASVAVQTDNNNFFTLDFNPITSVESVRRWLVAEYSTEDNRVETCDERKLRRLDSLSRLLSLSNSLSVCVAVTIDTTYKPRLIVAANVGSSNDKDKIVELLKSKIQTIKEFIIDVSKSTRLLSLLELEPICTGLVKKLIGFSSGVQPDIFLQSATKFIHAICFDPETFSDQEKGIFDPGVETVILIPDSHQNAPHLVAYLEDNHSGSILKFDLPPISNKVAVKNLHAEQLLAYFLFDISRLPTDNSRFNFGISKLCCRTCFECLQNYPSVAVRGQHNQEYQGVINLKSGQLTKQSSIRPGVTFPWSSPKDSPPQGEESRSSKRLGDKPRSVRNLTDIFKAYRVQPNEAPATPAAALPVAASAAATPALVPHAAKSPDSADFKEVSDSSSTYSVIKRIDPPKMPHQCRDTLFSAPISELAKPADFDSTDDFISVASYQS